MVINRRVFTDCDSTLDMYTKYIYMYIITLLLSNLPTNIYTLLLLPPMVLWPRCPENGAL